MEVVASRLEVIHGHEPPEAGSPKVRWGSSSLRRR